MAAVLDEGPTACNVANTRQSTVRANDKTAILMLHIGLYTFVVLAVLVLGMTIFGTVQWLLFFTRSCWGFLINLFFSRAAPACNPCHSLLTVTG